MNIVSEFMNMSLQDQRYVIEGAIILIVGIACIVYLLWKACK